MSRCTTICAVPRARATKVIGGPMHAEPGGRHAMYIGEMPGSSTAGLVDFGCAGHGNISAVTSWPSATWIVMPFCAGVTVTLPCAVLGAGLGGGEDRGGEGVDGRDDECAEEIVPGTEADVPVLDEGIPEDETGLESLESTVDP